VISALFVDDNQDHLSLASLFFSRSGEISIDPVSTAGEALEKLQEKSYDAIISDYYMPEMNGIELLKSIRKDYPYLPFILLTAKDEMEIAIEALNCGATFFLKKEGSPRQMMTDLEHLVQESVQNVRIMARVREQCHIFADLLVQCTVPIGVFDKDFNSVLLNAKYREIFQFDLGTDEGRHVQQLVPHFAGSWQPVHSEVFSKRRGSIIREEVIQTGGETYQFISVFVFLASHDEGPGYMVHYLIPPTEWLRSLSHPAEKSES
jgi:CheY-like chemotaxis protein